MKTTYSITEAQARLPALVREAEGAIIPITRHDKTVAYVVSRQRMDAIAETLELLADPGAMEAMDKARRGVTRYIPLERVDAD